MKIIKLASTAVVAIALLAMSTPIIPVQAVTYTEIAGQGKVLGDSTGFYPYPTGTLVNDNGTIYFISGTTKVPFTNWQAFVGLGYLGKTVVEGDLTNYTPSSNYVISTANAAHPWGSWIIYKGTVYYSSQGGLIGVPSAQVFTSNGGDWQYLVKANSYDVAILNSNPNLPVLSVNDSRVTTTPTYGNNNTNPQNNSGNTPSNLLTITPNSLPNATIGQPYSTQISVNGGTAPYTWSTISTTYPSGCCTLGLSGNTQPLYGPVTFNTQSGTTVINTYPAGTYYWTLQVKDAAGNTATQTLGLTINSASTQNNNTGSAADVPTAPVLAISGTSTLQQLVMVSKSPNGDNVYYTIDWGDNSTKEYYSAISGGIVVKPHTYPAIGTYTVTVSAATQNSAEISSTFQVIVSQTSNNPTTNSGASVSPPILNITVNQGAISSPQPVAISWPGYTLGSNVLPNAVLFGGVSSNSLNWLNISNSNVGSGSSILDLPANGTFYVYVNATNLTTGAYSGSISINNIGGNVPTVAISIPVNVTVTSPSLGVSLNSALPSTLPITAGTTNQKVASFQILNSSQSPAVVSSITLNATRNTIGNNFQNLKLMANASPSQIQIGSTQPTVSGNGVYTFTFNTPLIISAGASTLVEAYADIAAGVTNSTSGVANQNLVSLNSITGTWQINGASINSITPVAGQTISFPN